MKRQSLVLLAVAIAGAGAAGCFKDPVSNLRNGPSVLNLSNVAVFLRTGDSVVVTATLKDEGGNVLPATGVTWTSANTSLAVARLDTSLTIPGDAYSRGLIRAVDSVSGGWTTVTVNARGVEDTIRVVVLPAKLTAQHVAVAGPTLTDSVVIPPSAVSGTPVSWTEYTAGDTLDLTVSDPLQFDTSQVTVAVQTTNGPVKGYVVYKTPGEIKAVFGSAAAGRALVRHFDFTPGNAAVGTIAVDTLFTDSVAVAAFHLGGSTFGGSAVVAGDTVTVTAPTNMAFRSSTAVWFTAATDTVPVANVLYPFVQGRTSTTIAAISDTTLANQRVTLVNVAMAASGVGVDSVVFDSLKTNNAPYALNAATMPASMVVQTGDTVNITATAPVSFAATTKVQLGTNNAIIVSRPDTLHLSYVLSPVDYTGPLTVVNAKVKGRTIPVLPTTGSYTLSAFALPAASVNLGGAKLGDTVTVTAPTGLTFTTTGSVSNVILGNTGIPTSDTAWVLSRTATEIKAFAKRGGKGNVTVTNVNLGSLLVPTLGTIASMPIDSVASDFPYSTSQAAGEPLTIPANDTAIVYGSVPPAGEVFWTFTTSATHDASGTLAWFGSGNAYGSGSDTPAYTEDLDFLICNLADACDDYGNDLSGAAGATTSQPEKWSVAALPAGSYTLAVWGFNVSYSIVYQMTVILQ
jgi:hypothetical protein